MYTERVLKERYLAPVVSEDLKAKMVEENKKIKWVR